MSPRGRDKRADIDLPGHEVYRHTVPLGRDAAWIDCDRYVRRCGCSSRDERCERQRRGSFLDCPDQRSGLDPAVFRSTHRVRAVVHLFDEVCRGRDARLPGIRVIQQDASTRLRGPRGMQVPERLGAVCAMAKELIDDEPADSVNCKQRSDVPHVRVAVVHPLGDVATVVHVRR